MNKSNLLLFAVFFGTIAIDLISKLIVVLYGKPLYNLGVAFSLFANTSVMPLIFMGINILVTVILLTAILWGAKLSPSKNKYTTKIRWALNVIQSKPFACFGAMLIAGGALGNALDRLIHLAIGDKPYVTDFITYPGLFTGNIADIAIVLGVVIAAASVLRA